MRLGWVALKHRPLNPHLRPGSLRQKRPYSLRLVSIFLPQRPTLGRLGQEERSGTQGLDLLSGSSGPERPPRSPLSANGSLKSGDDEMRGRSWANQVPGAAREGCCLGPARGLLAAAVSLSPSTGSAVEAHGLSYPTQVGSSRTRDRSCVPRSGRWSLNHWTTGKPNILSYLLHFFFPLNKNHLIW